MTGRFGTKRDATATVRRFRATTSLPRFAPLSCAGAGVVSASSTVHRAMHAKLQAAAAAAAAAER